MVNFFITICVKLFPILVNLQVWYLVLSFCVDTCLGISKQRNKYGHGKIVSECKCSCSAGVESVDGITLLGKLYKMNVRLDWLVRLEMSIH